MKHVDVVELTQKAVAQTMGSEYMEQLGDWAALDSYKLVDVGKAVLDKSIVKDQGFGKFFDFTDDYLK